MDTARIPASEWTPNDADGAPAPEPAVESSAVSPFDTPPRFQAALDRARADWAAADPSVCAAHAGCELTPAGVLVPFFGRPHLVTHPDGLVTVPSTGAAAGAHEALGDGGAVPAHAAVAIATLHYLLTADGIPPAGNWWTFRELPDGLFYATAFAARAEDVLAQAFAATDDPSVDAQLPLAPRVEPSPRDGVARFRRAAAALGGEPLDLGDASFCFAAFPRVALAVLLWAGDEDEPGEARILFDAHAGHYLRAEDAAGLGEWLARQLVRPLLA